MHIDVRRAELSEVEALRACYRLEASGQIVRDSILGRGLADPYVVIVDHRIAAYGGVWNEHFPGRVMEFYATEGTLADAVPLFVAFLGATGATHIEAQSNMPAMLHLLTTCATDISEEAILFGDGPPTRLALDGATFRRRSDADDGPEGAWVVELGGRTVAGGGVLTHYNPPWADLYMEVAADHRRSGIGAYLVQELRRVCRASGMVPAARCDPANVASRRTLLRGGLVECARILAGRVSAEYGGRREG
jgi:GNAT superfamily N-acetyltransferase